MIDSFLFKMYVMLYLQHIINNILKYKNRYNEYTNFSFKLHIIHETRIRQKREKILFSSICIFFILK